jgi:uncharacterized protein involved in cysteine biosynthesis
MYLKKGDNMYHTISKSLKDMISPKVLMFILTIGLGSIAIWIAILIYFWESFESFFTSFLSWIPWESVQDSIAYVAAPLAGYTLIIVTISILTSLFSDKLMISLAKKHYPKQEIVDDVSITGSILVTIKSIIIFLALFMMLFPLIFIPILGQVVLLYLWSILLKEPMVHDVGGLFISDKKVLRQKRKKSTIIAMLASLFNYIPLLNIFAPVFAQILFLHHILKEAE